MKKRLLSALLALVMVLTMLPATVFATPVRYDKYTNHVYDGARVTYYAKESSDATLDNGNPIPARTWVYEYYEKVTGSSDVKHIIEVSNGVIVGTIDRTSATSTGTYYGDIDDAYDKGTNIVLNQDDELTGGSKQITKSFTVDVDGNTLTINDSNLDFTKSVTMTVTDSNYRKGYGSQGGVTFTGGLSHTVADRERTVNVTVRDAAVTGDITLNGNVTRTITLDNAAVGGSITLNGWESGTNAVKQARQTLTSTNGTTIGGNISVTGNGSTVSLQDTNVAAGSSSTVSLSGTGTTLNVTGTTDVWNVALFGAAAVNGKKATGNGPTVNVSGTIGNLTQGAGTESLDSPYKVNVSMGGTITSINLPNAEIKVNQGETGVILLGKGKLDITGPNAVVGDVTLGNSANLADSVAVNISGGNSTIGTIAAVNGSKHTLSVSNDRTTYIKDVTPVGSFNKGGIKGGSFGNAINAELLNRTGTDALQFMLADTVKYRYYTRLELAELVSDYIKADKALGESNSPSSAVIGHTQVQTLTLMNGNSEVWAKINYDPAMGSKIMLPAEVNGIKVQTWTDDNRTTWRGEYPLPVVSVQEVKLNAQSTGTNISKLTNATVKTNPVGDTYYNNVRASLSGNTISLSGAVNPNNGGTQIFSLYLTTDMVDESGNYVEVTIPVVYDSENKSQPLTIGNMNGVATSLLGGMTAQEGQTILKLSNGTTYTLNGSGLKVPTGDYSVDLELMEIVATDKVSGHTAGEKARLEGYLGSDNITDGVASKDGDVYANFKTSPAVLQAINAVEAGMTESQVTSLINTAQRNYWNANYTGKSPTKDQLAADGYNKVVIVPYLNVTATAYNPNQTITLTLEPYYRIEVRSTLAGDADPTTTTNHAPIVVKPGASLGKLEDGNDVMGTVTVKFNFQGANNKIPTGWMHQDATYAYSGATTANTFAIKHAGANNGLGTMIINSDAPLVTMTDGTNDVGFGYNTLQAAVDDAKNNYVINVDANYKGSMAINVTGEARKFKIVANGNTGVTTNTSNGLVDVTRSGHEYTVQLTRDVAATVDGTTASIAVATVNNGSARVSATSAKSGSTVTVTATPAAGYRTSGVSVTAHMTKTNTNAAVSVTRSSDNVYTFKVPEGASSITVTPTFVVGTTSTGLPFYDVAANDYYYEAVKYVYDNGLMNGVNTTGTQFGGSQTLNRAMVVTILYRAAGSPNVSSVSGFNDVANNTWYSQAVTWGNQNGIVQGDADATGKLTGTFRPADPISRQELATILYRYNTNYRGRATTGSTTLTNYVDQGSVSSWATAGMQWAVGNGIVNGTTNTTLTPGGNATRYQAATMLMRYGRGFGL